MADQAPEAAAPPIATVAQIIAQCRRDIAAAWTHLESAKDVLRRSRPLQERLREQIASAARAAQAHEEAPHPPRSQGFVMIPRAPGDRTHHRRWAAGR
jgi:hypothetical protein